MSSSRYVSRHARARRTRPSLPRIGGQGVARTAAKSVAGVGIVLGSGAFVIAPTSAIGTADTSTAVLGGQESSASDLLAERDGTATGGSRSVRRGAPVAIAAPSSGKGAEQSTVGELDVEAVAKPEPKPEPVEKDEPEPVEEEPSPEPEVSETPQPEVSETPEPETPQPEAEEHATEEREPVASPQQSDETTSDSGESPDARTEAANSGAPETGEYAAEAAGKGLGPNAQGVYSAVRTQFPDVSDIGGYRAGDPGDHGSGKAVDIMVTGARGDQIAAWLQQNAGGLNITYVIWEQRIWTPGGSWKPMEDRGSATQNHFDHVHVSVN
ncbi:hypothetical protein [Janibacter sp. GS2]|uniref:hypothetical protein n=1 Tax=Janibacter sp. GS2 TaxID=3442646 RepID=UPI003EBE4B81